MAPAFSPGPRGVFTAGQASLALWDQDLAETLWETDGLGRGGLGVDGADVFMGPWGGSEARDNIVRVSASTGSVEASGSIPPGVQAGLTDKVILVRAIIESAAFFIGVDRTTLTERWRRGTHGSTASVSSAGERFFALLKRGAGVECLDAASGEQLWTFDVALADRWGADGSRRRIQAGFHAVVGQGDRLVVVSLDGVVFLLDVETGDVIKSGKTEFPGLPLVTFDRVFFKQPFRLSEFHLGDMIDGRRVEYREAVEPLYGRQRPSVTGYWMAGETVFWTAAHGAVMAVDLSETRGKRASWAEEMPDTIMPLGRYPVGCGERVYYCAYSSNPDGPFGLYAYAGTE